MVNEDDGRELGADLTDDRSAPTSSLAALLETVLDQPDKWLATPNHQFGAGKPGELVGTADEVRILDVLRAVHQGFFDEAFDGMLIANGTSMGCIRIRMNVLNRSELESRSV
jgi:hypothetical protein